MPSHPARDSRHLQVHRPRLQGAITAGLARQRPARAHLQRITEGPHHIQEAVRATTEAAAQATLQATAGAARPDTAEAVHPVQEGAVRDILQVRQAGAQEATAAVAATAAAVHAAAVAEEEVHADRIISLI